MRLAVTVGDAFSLREAFSLLGLATRGLSGLVTREEPLLALRALEEPAVGDEMLNTDQQTFSHMGKSVHAHGRFNHFIEKHVQTKCYFTLRNMCKQECPCNDTATEQSSGTLAGKLPVGLEILGLEARLEDLELPVLLAWPACRLPSSLLGSSADRRLVSRDDLGVLASRQGKGGMKALAKSMCVKKRGAGKM